ncbi:MAG: GIY-YIG nuclease family protein [Patescibacteria group bacterium]
MEKTKSYYVYIATNQRNTVLYTGVTNNITRRMYEHKNKLISGFTKKYNVNKLIFCEEFSDPVTAINNEKKIKGWLRKKKIDLIKKGNPDFRDLSS